MQDKNLLKETLKKYSKDKFQNMSWDEFDEELSKLAKKVIGYVKDDNLQVDAVVPLLRGGNIPATYLAYVLDVLLILPVQYKYFFAPGKCELRRIHGIDQSLIAKKDPTFLLVEGNHCYGNQAKYAAADLKKLYPNCRIIYGASNMDYNYQDAVQDAEVSFFGNLTNACKELTDEECQRLGLEYKRELIFPWEKVEEEWDIIELKQRKYVNVAEIKSQATVVAEYDLN